MSEFTLNSKRIISDESVTGSSRPLVSTSAHTFQRELLERSLIHVCHVEVAQCGEKKERHRQHFCLQLVANAQSTAKVISGYCLQSRLILR